MEDSGSASEPITMYLFLQFCTIVMKKYEKINTENSVIQYGPVVGKYADKFLCAFSIFNLTFSNYTIFFHLLCGKNF